MKLRDKILQPYKLWLYKRACKRVTKAFGGPNLFSKPPTTHVLLDRMTNYTLIDDMEAGE